MSRGRTWRPWCSRAAERARARDRLPDNASAQRARRARQRGRRRPRSFAIRFRREHAAAALAMARRGVGAAGKPVERSRSWGSTVARRILRRFSRSDSSGSWRSHAPSRSSRRLLLLDEPAAGLRGGEKERLIEALRTLYQRGLTDDSRRARHAVRRGARRTRRRSRPGTRDRRRNAGQGPIRPPGNRGVPRLDHDMTTIVDVRGSRGQVRASGGSRRCLAASGRRRACGPRGGERSRKVVSPQRGLRSRTAREW